MAQPNIRYVGLKSCRSSRHTATATPRYIVHIETRYGLRRAGHWHHGHATRIPSPHSQSMSRQCRHVTNTTNNTAYRIYDRQCWFIRHNGYKVRECFRGRVAGGSVLGRCGGVALFHTISRHRQYDNVTGISRQYTISPHRHVTPTLSRLMCSRRCKVSLATPLQQRWLA